MREFGTIDDSRFPIVVIRFHDFIPTLEEFVANQEKFEKFAEKYENFVTIIDLADIAFLPSQYRLAQMKWHLRNEEFFLKRKLRLAFCTPSLVSRMVMKALFLTQQPRIPYAVLPTIKKAEAWAIKQLATPYPGEKIVNQTS